MSNEDEDWKVRMKQYRKEKFDVTVEPSRYEPDEAILSCTLNGTQWTSLSFTKEESHRAIKALQDYWKDR